MPRFDGARRLIGFGLSLASDRDVPGALPDQRAERVAPDLRITTLPALAPSEPQPPVYRWEHDILTFSAPGVGRYTCRQDSIDVAPATGADPDMVTALLIATALPAVLWLRGYAVLHAAAVVVPSSETAIAIAGPSGVGKSALTAELLALGGRLLADDSIALRRCNDRITGSGLSGGYHLGRAGDDLREFHRVSATSSQRSATIGSVVILSRTEGTPALIPLNPVVAVERLLANLHRPAVPALLGRRGDALTTLAFIAQNCAVYEWHRPGAALGTAERDMFERNGLW